MLPVDLKAQVTDVKLAGLCLVEDAENGHGSEERRRHVGASFLSADFSCMDLRNRYADYQQPDRSYPGLFSFRLLAGLSVRPSQRSHFRSFCLEGTGL